MLERLHFVLGGRVAEGKTNQIVLNNFYSTKWRHRTIGGPWTKFLHWGP